MFFLSWQVEGQYVDCEKSVVQSWPLIQFYYEECASVTYPEYSIREAQA